MLAYQYSGRAGDVLAHRNPGDRREELLERWEFFVSDSRDELEPNDLARGEGLVVLDEVFQEVDVTRAAIEHRREMCRGASRPIG
jgi:hypothetical protein